MAGGGLFRPTAPTAGVAGTGAGIFCQKAKAGATAPDPRAPGKRWFALAGWNRRPHSTRYPVLDAGKVAGDLHFSACLQVPAAPLWLAGVIGRRQVQASRKTHPAGTAGMDVPGQPVRRSALRFHGTAGCWRDRLNWLRKNTRKCHPEVALFLRGRRICCPFSNSRSFASLRMTPKRYIFAFFRSL